MKAYRPSEELERQLAALPDAPGVYFFKDACGDPIYIGKAVSLRSRVRSYWNTTSWRERPKLAVMIPRVSGLETIITNSEKEALLLEATLIRKHMPRYNVALKDDKRYPWLAITYDESFPRLIMVRDPARFRKDNSKAKTFGPYVETGLMWETVRVLRKVFPMRQRRTPLFRDRPCMNYHIGLCLGPCQKLVDEGPYMKMVKQVELFLSGRQNEVVQQLKREMEESSERLEFEQAARIRNRLFALKKIIEKQQVFFEDQNINFDVLSEAHTERNICVCLLRIREGKLVSSENFQFPLVDWEKHLKARGDLEAEDSSEAPGSAGCQPALAIETPAVEGAGKTPAASSAARKNSYAQEAFQAFVDQYYTACDDLAVPQEVIVQRELEDAAALAELLSGKAGRNVKVHQAQRGKKVALLDMARKNAEQELETQAAHESAQGEKVIALLVKLKEELNLSKPPRRIECFDISNIQGTDNVSSMVVFENAVPKKADYRHFKIRSVEGQANDFASMEETVHRRYRRLIDEGKPMPDLIIIDGGKGQLGAAVSALSALGIEELDIIGLAKKQEEVYLPGVSDPVLLPRRSEALFLLQRVRDEAHRFAVTFHRKLRAKRVIKSELDKLPGVGASRRKILLDHFGSFDKLKEATEEELKTVPGIPASVGQAIYNALRTES